MAYLGAYPGTGTYPGATLYPGAAVEDEDEEAPVNYSGPSLFRDLRWNRIPLSPANWHQPASSKEN